MQNAQNYLNRKYPKEIRNLIKELYLRGKNLEGHLDLTDFTDLERLDCSYNQLTGLDLTGLNLKVLYCDNNCLTVLDYYSLNPNKLTGLIIDNNNLLEQDIAIFSQFTNLEDLRIGSTDKEKHNRFYGSLKHLKNLTKLEDLDISNTDINSGAECLPVGIKRICYSVTRSNSKVEEITEKLDSFLNLEIKEDWKDIHPDFTERNQREWENLGFNYHQTSQWIEAGLQIDEYYFVAYLRGEGYCPRKSFNWEELRKKNRSVQNYLNENYSIETRKWTNWLEISKKGLVGDLIVEDWPNLEKIDCYHNQISNLTLSNCPKLTRVVCSQTIMNNLTIDNCSEISNLNASDSFLSNLEFLSNLDPDKLTFLYLTNNDFPSKNIDIFSRFVNLKYLYLANNNFYGSLQSFRNLNKLERLGISGTDVSNDLEYLPESLMEIAFPINHHQSEKKSADDFKIVRLTNLMKKNEYHSVPSYDFKHWKENQPYFKWLKEELEKLDPNLNVYDFLKNVFFNVKTGEFVGDLQAVVSLLNVNKTIIDEKNKEIKFLELRIRELTNLVKKQKEKMVQSYLYFSSEKESLKELITTYLDFVKFKEQMIDSFDYDEKCGEYEEKCWKIKKKLREKLTKEDMNELRHVLTDCEKLVNWELDLENKLNFQSLLLEEQKGVPQLDDNSNYSDGQSTEKKLIAYQEKNKEFSGLSQVVTEKENKIQEWLDWSYSQKERSTIEKLDVSDSNLQGKLNLVGFSSLRELDCHKNQITELELSDCPNLEKIYCSVNQLTSLDLSNCSNLKVIDCGFNKLDNLDLTGLTQLEEFSCNDNYLNGLDYSSLEPDKLVYLNISDNNFSEKDLSIFSKFVNLESLLIGNDEKEKIKKNIYNRFYGSLEPLQNLTKLELLYINNIDVDSGLDYLSENLEVIYCSSQERPESKVKKLVEILSGFLMDEDKFGFEFQEWKKSINLEKYIEVPTKK